MHRTMHPLSPYHFTFSDSDSDSDSVYDFHNIDNSRLFLDTDDVIRHMFSYCDFPTILSVRCTHRRFRALTQHTLLNMERDVSDMLIHGRGHGLSCSSHNADPDPVKGEMYHSCHIQLKPNWTFETKAAVIDGAVMRADPGMFVSLEGIQILLGSSENVSSMSMDMGIGTDMDTDTDLLELDVDLNLDSEQPNTSVSVRYNEEHAKRILAQNNFVNVYHFLPMAADQAYPPPDQVPPLSTPLGWEIRIRYDEEKEFTATTCTAMSVSDAWHMIQNTMISQLHLHHRRHDRSSSKNKHNNIQQLKQYILCLLLQAKPQSIRCCYITYDYQCYDCPAGGTQRCIMFETSDGYPVEVCANVHYSVPGFNTPHAVL